MSQLATDKASTAVMGIVQVCVGSLMAILSIIVILSIDSNIAGACLLVVSFAVVLFLGRLRPKWATALLVAFLARAGLAVVDTFIFGLPDTGGDTVWFELSGYTLAAGGLSNVLAAFQSGSRLYVFVVGLVSAVFGNSGLLIRAINVLLGVLVVWITARTTEILWGRRESNRIVWLAALFPSMMLYSSVILREAFVACFLSLLVLNAAKWYGNGRTGHWILSVICGLVATGFHTGMLFALSVVIILPLLVNPRARPAAIRLSPLLRYFLSAAVIAVVCYIVFSSGWGLDKVGDAQNLESLIAKQATSRGRTGYLSGMDANSLLDVVWQLPIRFVFLAFTPFLWSIRTLSDLIGGLDALLWVVLAVCLFRSIKRRHKSGAIVWMLLILLLTLATFSFYISNTGTAIRHRTKVVPLLLMVSAGAFSDGVKEKRENRRYSSVNSTHGFGGLHRLSCVSKAHGQQSCCHRRGQSQ